MMILNRLLLIGVDVTFPSDVFYVGHADKKKGKEGRKERKKEKEKKKRASDVVDNDRITIEQSNTLRDEFIPLSQVNITAVVFFYLFIRLLGLESHRELHCECA